MNTTRSAALLAACSCIGACGDSSKPPQPLPSRPGGQVAGPKVAPTGATGAAPSAPAPTGTPAKPAEPKPAEPKPLTPKPAETKPASAAPTGATGVSGSTGATGAAPPATAPSTQPPAPPRGEPEVLKRTETDTGLIIEDLRYGTGEEVKQFDTITVHYRGTFAVNGQTFDASYDRNQPLTYALTGLMKGWQEGIVGMKVGSRRRLIVPPELGYGTTKDIKMGNIVIPKNSMLVFDIELLGTKR